MGKGMTASNTITQFDPAGTHSESFWRSEFGAVYTWLFQNENLLGTTTSTYQTSQIIQTVSGKIYIEGLPSATQFELFDLLGKHVKSMTLSNGIYEMPDELSKGIYILKSKNNEIASIKLVRS